MNEVKSLKLELAAKVLDANESGTPYNFFLELDENGFDLKVFASHSKLLTTVFHRIASCKNNYVEEEETKALNQAHVVMNDFARNGDYQLNTGIRLGMATSMVGRLEEQSKDVDIAYVAEYFNLDPFILEGAVNGKTA